MDNIISNLLQETEGVRDKLNLKLIGQEEVWGVRLIKETVFVIFLMVLGVIFILEAIEYLVYGQIEGLTIIAAVILVLYQVNKYYPLITVWHDLNAYKGYPTQLDFYTYEQPQQLKVKSKGAVVQAYYTVPTQYVEIDLTTIQEVFEVEFRRKNYKVGGVIKNKYEEDDRLYYYNKENYEYEYKALWGVRLHNQQTYFFLQEGLIKHEKFNDYIERHKIPITERREYKDTLPIGDTEEQHTFNLIKEQYEVEEPQWVGGAEDIK